MKVDVYDEYEIIQNELLGVHVLHEFVKYYTANNNGVGPKLYWAFPILPIIFNAESTNLIHSRNYTAGSFIKVISEKSDLFSTLQIRMQNLSRKTFACIYHAANSGLFSYDPVTARLFLISQGDVIKGGAQLTKEYQQMIAAAKRLGCWFAKMSEEELLIYLNIKF